MVLQAERFIQGNGAFLLQCIEQDVLSQLLILWLSTCNTLPNQYPTYIRKSLIPYITSSCTGLCKTMTTFSAFQKDLPLGVRPLR